MKYNEADLKSRKKRKDIYVFQKIAECRLDSTMGITS